VNEFLRRADEMPVTLLVALAYITLAFLTDPFHPTSSQLVHYGALRAVDAADGEPWRLLTHAFLHGGIVHLGVNTISLLSIGPLLERSIGPVRFAVAYVVTAVAGGIAGCWAMHPLSPLVGGSGALFGMMGALLALVARSGRHAGDFFGNHAARVLTSNIVANLAIGFLLPLPISNAAHVGGMVAGFLLVLVFLDPGRRGPTRMLQAWRVTLAALFASMVFQAVMPVTRWDWLLLRWERAAAGPRRDALGEACVRAYARATGQPDDVVAGERELEDLARDLGQARNFTKR
jgi:membrane associated rhomboid family serine protease